MAGELKWLVGGLRMLMSNWNELVMEQQRHEEGARGRGARGVCSCDSPPRALVVWDVRSCNSLQ